MGQGSKFNMALGQALSPAEEAAIVKQLTLEDLLAPQPKNKVEMPQAIGGVKGAQKAYGATDAQALFAILDELERIRK